MIIIVYGFNNSLFIILIKYYIFLNNNYRMENLDNCINLLWKTLVSKAPRVRPCIFPSSFSDRSIDDILKTTEQKNIFEEFQKKHNNNNNLFLQTNLNLLDKAICINIENNDDELDKKIASLEYLMRLFIIGPKEEIEILNNRFLEVNNVVSDENSSKIVLQEVSYLAYSLKIALRFKIFIINFISFDKILYLLYHIK